MRFTRCLPDEAEMNNEHQASTSISIKRIQHFQPACCCLCSPPGEAGPANSGNKQQTANPPNSRPSEAQRLPSRMRTAAGVNQLRGARTRPGTEAAAVAAVQQQDPATPSTDSNSGSSSSSTPTLSTGEQPDTSPPPDQAPDQKPVDTPADQQAQKQQPYCIPNKQGDVFSVLAAGDSITQGSVPSRNRNWPYAIRLTQLLIRKLGIFASAQDAGAHHLCSSAGLAARSAIVVHALSAVLHVSPAVLHVL